MTNPYKLFVGAAMVVVLAGCSKGPTQPQAGAGQGIPVSVETAKLQTVADSTEYLGTVRSRDSAVIQPQVEGHITKILVHSGEKVRAGDPILQIDPLKQEATVNTQVANASSQRAQL